MKSPAERERERVQAAQERKKMALSFDRRVAARRHRTGESRLEARRGLVGGKPELDKSGRCVFCCEMVLGDSHECPPIGEDDEW